MKQILIYPLLWYANTTALTMAKHRTKFLLSLICPVAFVKSCLSSGNCWYCPSNLISGDLDNKICFKMVTPSRRILLKQSCTCLITCPALNHVSVRLKQSVLYRVKATSVNTTQDLRPFLHSVVKLSGQVSIMMI